jgi:hypothetical protein
LGRCAENRWLPNKRRILCIYADCWTTNPNQKKQAEVANFALATTVDALKRGGIPVKLRFDGEPSTSIKGSWMTHAATARAGLI